MRCKCTALSALLIVLPPCAYAAMLSWFVDVAMSYGAQQDGVREDGGDVMNF
jgi:hypothetical protein